MTESPDTPAAGNDNKSNPTSTILRFVLLGVLVVMVGLLMYDWFVARPGAKAAHDALAKLDEDNNSRPLNSRYTREDVVAKIGEPASSTKDEETGKLEERYTWRRGSLYNTYYVVVLYQKDRDAEDGTPGKYRYLRHSFNEEPDKIFERTVNPPVEDSTEDADGGDASDDTSSFPDQGEGDGGAPDGGAPDGEPADAPADGAPADGPAGGGDPPADDGSGDPPADDGGDPPADS